MNIKAVFFILTSVIIGFSARAEGSSSPRCFPSKEIKELSESFFQLLPYVKDAEQICSDQLGEQWTMVIETLIDLKSFKIASPRAFKTKDDLSFKAIQQDGWWSYFTQRAKFFVLDNQECRLSSSTIAFVKDSFPGMINLCPPFFKTERASRIHFLMHEVRHFDGFDHVKCTHGDAKGAEGACDQTLYEKGSYAVQMQTSAMIGLYGQGFNEAERAFARASALNTLQNRFNEGARLKIKESLYLENSEGSIFEWHPSMPGQLRPLTKLKEPGRIYSSGLETIVYPLNTDLPAYRELDDFSLPSMRLGLFAEIYNKSGPNERADFLELGYGEGGGIITPDKLLLNCRFGPLVEREIRTLREPVITFLNLINENSEEAVTEFLLGDSGRLYKKRCDEGAVKVPDTQLTADRQMRKTLVVEGKTYALSDSGRLHVVEKNQFHYSLGKDLLPQKESWLDMTNRTIPYLYDEAKGSGK